MAKLNLSTPQQNIWNLQSFYSDSAISNICGSVFLSAPLKETLLGDVLNNLIKNNNALRMIIQNKNNPEVTYREHTNIIFEELDYSNKTNQEISKILQIRSEEPIGLFGDLCEFVIVKRSTDWGVYIKISHLIADAWSLSLIIKNTVNNYLEAINNNHYESLSSDYNNFIKSETDYQTSSRYQKDKEFFDILFKEEPKFLTFGNSQNKIKAKRKNFTLTKEETKKIKEYCSQNNIATGTLFESAMAVYMHRYFNEAQIILGMPVVNRSNFEQKQTIGMFISTMPLVINVDSHKPVKELINEITAKHYNLFKHQRFPLTELGKALKEKYNFQGRLFDVTISYQDAKANVNNDFVTESNWYFNGYSETGLVIHLSDMFNSDKLELNFDYQTSVFKALDIDYLKRRLLTIVDDIIANDTTLVKDVRLMDCEEYKLITEVFNDTDTKYDDTLTVVDMFNNAVKKTPNKIALIFEDRKYTYTELDNITTNLALFLQKQGICKGGRIALLTKRSDYTIFGMLATIKAGAAYMPLDINYPDDRINYLLKEANIKLILGYEHEFKNQHDYPIIAFNDIVIDQQTISAIEYNIKPEDTYCILHTSGSTGKPKAIELAHSSFVNIYSTKKDWLKDIDNVISLTSLTFDLFRLDSIFPLMHSKTAVLTSDEELNSSEKLGKLLSKYKNNLVVSVPTKMLLYLEHADDLSLFSTIKRYLIGGEVFPGQLFKKIKQINKTAEVINGYGPAEATLFSTFKLVNDNNYNIGKPLPNYKVFIMDPLHRVVPIGFSGEICIGGRGLAKGYTTKELTTKSFINGFYCSGDLGKYNHNGELELMGRVDNQVKIRGLRIELEEIEEQLKQVAGVKNAACKVITDQRHKQILYAFYVANQELSEVVIRESLLSTLPRYMVPNYFIYMKELPLNYNGKIDRNKLTPPNEVRTCSNVEPPVSYTEQKLHDMLLKLLPQNKVIGINDDFFEIGLDSLGLIDLLNHIEKDLKISIKIKDIFNYPNIKILAEAIDRNQLIDFEKPSINLGDIIVNKHQNNGASILLTGANGYLGSHILMELLTKSDKEIIIIIRNETRFKRAFKFYFNEDYIKYRDRIKVFIGNITDNNLGVSEGEYLYLLNNVASIIHSAANVKHFGQMKEFYDINVTSTLNLLSLAATTNSEFNYISTISISGAGMTRQTEENIVFGEDSFDVGQIITDNVYLHTKYLSELAIKAYQKQGLLTRIFRVGNLSERKRDGKFQINASDNGMKIRIKAIQKLGAMPKDFESILLDMSYVDKVAEAINIVIKNEKAGTYHVFNNNLLTVKQHLQNYGIKYKPTGLKYFLEKIKVSTDPDIKTFGLYMQYIGEYKKAKMQTINYKTQAILAKYNFTWEE